MSKGILYVAASLDGHIARKDGDVSWLDACQTEDYGYKEFLSSVETVIMCSKTYEQSLTFGPWQYEKQKTYVVTRRTFTKNSEEISSFIRAM